MDNLLESADGKMTYQGIELHHLNDVVVNSGRQQALSDLRKLDDELKERLSLVRHKTYEGYYGFLGQTSLVLTQNR